MKFNLRIRDMKQMTEFLDACESVKSRFSDQTALTILDFASRAATLIEKYAQLWMFTTAVAEVIQKIDNVQNALKDNGDDPKTWSLEVVFDVPTKTIKEGCITKNGILMCISENTAEIYDWTC